MGEDFIKDFTNSINSLPPLIRYPALLLLCKCIYEILPQAEKEYYEERQVILESFIGIIGRKDLYD